MRNTESWMCFPDGSAVRIQLQCRRHRGCRFNPWIGNIPWRRKWQPALVFLPGKFYRQRSWLQSMGVSESDTTKATEHMWHQSRQYEMGLRKSLQRYDKLGEERRGFRGSTSNFFKTYDWLSTMVNALFFYIIPFKLISVLCPILHMRIWGWACLNYLPKLK